MKKTSTCEIAGVGPVRFVRSERARRMNISIKPFKGVRVAVPYGYTLEDARGFVLQNRAWLQEKLLNLDGLEQEMRAAFQRADRIDRAGAEQILTARLDELALRFGFRYNRLTFRNQKTRWGSCSANNNISLNRQIILLPEELIDYVLLHELVHTRVKNHSKAFWAELEDVLPGASDRANELKRYRIGHV